MEEIKQRIAERRREREAQEAAERIEREKRRREGGKQSAAMKEELRRKEVERQVRPVSVVVCFLARFGGFQFSWLCPSFCFSQQSFISGDHEAEGEGGRYQGKSFFFFFFFFFWRPTSDCCHRVHT